MNFLEKKLYIHNVLKLKICYPKKEPFIEDINFPFKYFEKEYEGEPEIVFNFGPFSRKKVNCEIVFRNTEISENYIYFKKKNNGSFYEVEVIMDSSDYMCINFNWIKKGIYDHLFPYYRPQLFILEPIIEYKLLLKGWVLLHGAGISKDGGASIFVGRSGTYKSPIAKNYIKKLSAEYLGDDKLLIKDNYVYCFPKNISLFEYELLRKDSMIELNRNKEKFFYILYSLFNKNKKFFKIKNKEKINSVFFLLKSHQKNSIGVEPVEKEIFFNSLIYNNYSEFWNYYDIWDHFIAYSYVYNDFPFINYTNMLDNILRINLNEVTQYYIIKIPANFNKYSIDKLVDMIERIYDK